MTYDFGFQFDGYLGYNEYTKQLNDSKQRLILADPIFHKFSNGTQTVKKSDRVLTLDGQGLMNCCEATDFSVFVGGLACDVTRITDSTLECLLSRIIPGLEDLNSTDHDVSVSAAKID